LHQDSVTILGDHGFHVSEALVNRSNFIATALEKVSIGSPCGIQSFERIVEEIDVARQPSAPGKKVQRNPSRYIGLSLLQAVGCYETTDGLLESGDSH